MTPFMEWNLNCLRAIAELRTPLLDTLMQGVTELGGETLFMLFMLVVFWCVDKNKGYFLMLLCFTGTAVNQMLKITFCIPRPWVLDPSFEIVESARAGATGFSFPSGHTQNAVGTLGGIARWHKSRALRIVCIVLAALTAFSRMYLGVHTPLDVGVSFGIGLVLVFALYPLFRDIDSHPNRLYWLFGAMAALGLAYLLFAELWPFPADVDAANLASGRKNAYTLLGAVLGMTFSYWLDRRYVHFDVRAVWWAQVLKAVLGLAITIGLRAVLKAPLLALCGGHNIANLIRYALMVIFAAGIWPMTFGWFGRLGRNKPVPGTSD